MKVDSKTAMIVSIVGVSLLAVLFSLAPKPPSEAERVAAANEKYYAEIFHRCQNIPELKAFIDLYQPTSALEFFDNETLSQVVEVACRVQIDERYEAAFVAKVRINEEGFYDLTAEPSIWIEDSLGQFTTNYRDGVQGRGSMRKFSPEMWSSFVESGAKVEDFRTIYAPGPMLRQ